MNKPTRLPKAIFDHLQYQIPRQGQELVHCPAALLIMASFNLTESEKDRITHWVVQDYTSQTAGHEVPVTPGVHHSGETAYFENRPSTTASENRAFDPQGATPGPRWNPNLYDDATENSSGVALIRRLAKASLTGNEANQDPVQQYPNLSLSGRVISATFNVPYSISFSPGNDWVRRSKMRKMRSTR